MQAYIAPAASRRMTKVGVLGAVILIGGFCLLNPLISWSAEPVPVSIMVPATADPVLKFAAQDLGNYLKELTGEPVARQNPDAQHHIYLG